MANYPVVVQEADLQNAAKIYESQLNYPSLEHPSHLEDMVAIAIFALAGGSDFEYWLVHQQEKLIYRIFTAVLGENSSEMTAYFLTLAKESQEIQDWRAQQPEVIDEQKLLVGIGELLAQVR